MLTLAEVLDDVRLSPGFEGVSDIGVNSRGSSGERPLHWMAVLGDHDAIQLLIAAGAEIDAIDDSGQTALHMAIENRQTVAARMLLTLGANCNIRDRAGRTPSDIAREDRFLATRKLFEQFESDG